MHERLEHFIAVFEVQFLLDILEVDTLARNAVKEGGDASKVGAAASKL